jgi:hypothetical protein
MGAFVEHSLAMFLGKRELPGRTAADLRRQIDAAGVDSTILCSDLGQVGSDSPLRGFQRGVEMCMDLGYEDADIHKMVATNAARAGVEFTHPELWFDSGCGQNRNNGRPAAVSLSIS